MTTLLRHGRNSKAKLQDSRTLARPTRRSIVLAWHLELKENMCTTTVGPNSVSQLRLLVLNTSSKVHENVQPVIHKETVQPEVVHTTVPIHELHRAEAEHHGTSVLPVKKLEEFTAGGGTLTGGGHKAHEAYEGDPKPYNKEMQMDRTDADTNFHAHDGLHDHQRTMGSSDGGTTTSGPHSSSLANKMDPRVESDRDTSGVGAGAGSGMDSNTTGTGQY